MFLYQFKILLAEITRKIVIVTSELSSMEILVWDIRVSKVK